MAVLDPARGVLAVNSRAVAEQLLVDTLAAMASLQTALDLEADRLAAGQIRAGLAEATQKSELGAAYLLRLQVCKANVVALARFAPDLLSVFRAAQDTFMRAVERNLQVVGTARAVAEGLVKSLATEVQQSRQVGGYSRPQARPGPPPRASSVPLVFSGSF